MSAGMEESGRDRWRRAYERSQKRDADFTTVSGLGLDPVYGPPDDQEPPDSIGWPGEFPFTRGLYASGYRLPTAGISHPGSWLDLTLRT